MQVQVLPVHYKNASLFDPKSKKIVLSTMSNRTLNIPIENVAFAPIIVKIRVGLTPVPSP